MIPAPVKTPGQSARAGRNTLALEAIGYVSRHVDRAKHFAGIQGGNCGILDQTRWDGQ